MNAASDLPDDKDALKAALTEANAALSETRAKLSGAVAMIGIPTLNTAESVG